MRNFLLFILFISIKQFAIAQFGPPGGGGFGGGERQRPSNQNKPELDLGGNIPKGNSKISGNIIDSAVTVAVEYANVALYNKETKKPVDGAMADDKGFFALKRVAAGKYYLQISFIGFENSIIDNIVVEKGKDIDLGVLKLKQNTKQLNEIVVTGQAALIEEKVDRLVYNAERDLTSKGGDASDVLKNVPMLSVDLEGNVSLRGSSNIKVLINNKPSTIVASSIADALKMLPAELIKSVEVITSPSAKYDAEGSAGIINIITKKSTLQGLNLNLDAGVGVRGSNLNLSGNYRVGKLGLNLGGHGRAGYNPMNTVSEQNIIGSGIRTIQEQVGKNFMMFGRYNLGFDYDLAKNQSLSGSLAFGTRRMNRDQFLTSNTFKNGIALNTILRDVAVIDNSNNIDANVDYVRTFKPGQEFSISTQYSTNNLINNFNSDLVNDAKAILSRQKNINGNINQEITLQTDYVHPVSKNKQIEIGAKGVFRNVNSDFEYLFASPNGTFANDAKNPMGYLNYYQNVMAGYMSYLFSTKNRINFKVGARYEHTDISGDETKGAIKIPSYDNLVPSINISKSIKQTTYKIAYNRRIQRPGLQQLNPNVNLANPLSISYGNSSLNPELTNNLELSVSGSVKKSYLTFSVFGRQSNNAITRLSFASKDIEGGIVSTFENIGKEQTLGSNMFGNVFLSSKWTLNGGVDVYYKYLEGRQISLSGISEQFSNDGIVVSGRIMSNVKLNKGWAIQAHAGMRGRQINLQGYQGSMGMYSLGFRKDQSKKLSIGLGFDNFFGGLKLKNITKSPTISQMSTNYMYNSNVKLTFSYKLGNMKFVEQKKGKKVKNDDVKEGGTDN